QGKKRVRRTDGTAPDHRGHGPPTRVSELDRLPPDPITAQQTQRGSELQRLVDDARYPLAGGAVVDLLQRAGGKVLAEQVTLVSGERDRARAGIGAGGRLSQQLQPDQLFGAGPPVAGGQSPAAQLTPQRLGVQ